MHTKHPTYSPIMINFTPQLHRTLHKTAFILVNNTACSQLAQQENKTFAPRKKHDCSSTKTSALSQKEAHLFIDDGVVYGGRGGGLGRVVGAVVGRYDWYFGTTNWVVVVLLRPRGGDHRYP